MDIVFVILTVVFFVFSWGLVVLCERLIVNGKGTSTHEGL